LKTCSARIRIERLVFFTADDVNEQVCKVNTERFQNVFDIKYNSFAEMWDIQGKDDLRWVSFRIWFQRQRVVWRHDDDLIVSEWVVFSFCHRVARSLDPRAQYRDEADNFLQPLDFDLKFPTLDLWIRQINYVSGDHPDAHLHDARSRTPVCFWRT
jgi:hypothetical protein